MFTLRIIGRHFEDLYTPASYRFIHPSIGVPKILKVDLEVFLLVCPSSTLLLETSGSMLLHFHKPTVDARNPAPADRVKILLFTKFCTSHLVQDFFHHQYHWPTKHTNTPHSFFVEKFTGSVVCVFWSTSAQQKRKKMREHVSGAQWVFLSGITWIHLPPPATPGNEGLC